MIVLMLRVVDREFILCRGRRRGRRMRGRIKDEKFEDGTEVHKDR